MLVYVLGYLDSYGAVHAREFHTDENGCELGEPFHTAEEKLAGRPFRFVVKEQNFCFMTWERISDDEAIVIKNWLINMGYINDLY